MITILHGDNIVASRNRLKELSDEARLKKLELIRLDGQTLNQDELIQALESSSLFGQERLVIIEKLSPAIKIDYLFQHADKQIIVWEPKALTSAVLKKLKTIKNVNLQLFKTPAVIFKFLDSIKPGNNQSMLNLFHQCLEKDSVEMIFYMLCRRFSQLIQALDQNGVHLQGAPWQIGKLKSQAKNFSLKSLLHLQQQLLSIDANIKAGRNIIPLSSQLDLLLLNI